METMYYGHLGTKSSYIYTLCFVHNINNNPTCGVCTNNTLASLFTTTKCLGSKFPILDLYTVYAATRYLHSVHS